MKKLFPMLAFAISLIASTVQAQTFTTLYNFTNGIDGAFPYGIILSGSNLYGVTVGGVGVVNTNTGSNIITSATVYSINTNGTGLTTLHTFTGSEGSVLLGALVLSGGTLYGTAAQGGSSGWGTVFSVKTDGTGFTILHNFTAIPNNTNTDGAYPYAGLITSGGTLYGTTARGGSNSYGTVFAINGNGSGFTILHTFTDGGNGDSSARLVLSGNILYGTARYGGTSSFGTVFSLDTSGNNFTILHNFTAGTDGRNPEAGLVLSGGTLYGVASAGGSSFGGTVFKLNTDGSAFTTLHSFAQFDANGQSPLVELIISGSTLYGTTDYGGQAGYQGSGTAFTLQTDGSGFATLHSFSHLGTDGEQPQASLILAGSTLYGTADEGGTSHRGTVYSIALPCAPAVLNIAQYSGITIIGTVGCQYRIDYTTLLNPPNTVWTPLTTLTLTSSPFFYMDPTPNQGNRFYRAVVQ